jgi:hypothetical protein
MDNYLQNKNEYIFNTLNINYLIIFNKYICK